MYGFNKSGCSFFMRFSFNGKSGYYCLEDYDEIHNHPCTPFLKGMIRSD